MVSENPPDESVSTPATRAPDGTGLLMIGGAVIVAGFLIFSVIMGEFTFSAVFTAIAALVVMSVRGLGGIALGRATLKALGYFMGLVAVILLIGDLRFGFPEGVADNLANITFYIGSLLMFLGARGIDD